ncbi:MAG: FixH family protein [Campylobacterales bacterium]|nr:FixH family protein [Campylobacterales bacterium]
MKKNSGKIWPYAISISIALIFGAGVTTIVIATSSPVQKSDAYMMDYHEADAKANELIESRIAFDKKYKIEYITDSLNCNGSVIKYKVSDLNSKKVDDANITVVLTRPDGHQYDKELSNPTIEENGVYSFASINLEKEGRWDIMAKVSVGDLQRYYNVKADTRAKESYEY